MTENVNCANVGIMTWHYATNIGSNLQAYAMQYIIEHQNKRPIFLNYRGRTPADSGLRKALKILCSSVDEHFPDLLPERVRVQAYHFQNQYLKMTESLVTNEQLFECSRHLQCIVCGSDQIWAPNVYDPVYQLSFCNEKTKKCAYAASIGLPEIPKELILEYKKNLSRFDYITVREKQGAVLLSSILNKEIPWVLDPTLLVPLKEWKKLSKRPEVREPYLFCYFLGGNQIHRKIAKQYAKVNNLKIICCSDYPEDKAIFNCTISHMGPREFLGYIENCTMSFTDSFHGILFSMIFRKDFYTVHRFHGDDKICQNSRVDNILELAGLSRRCLSDDEATVTNEPIDYVQVDTLLEEKRMESLQHLRNCLA